MSHLFRQHQAYPPIDNISVNKFNVAFTDRQSRKKVSFDNALQARTFVAWLQNLLPATN